MLSFSKLGTHGRLGNQFFQVAGTLGLAEKHNTEAVFPDWEYEKYFKRPLPHGPMVKNQVKEKHFHYHDWDLNGDSDILGYLQSEKYFPSNIKDQFVFKPEFIEATKNKMPSEIWDKEVILMQIRRGDYVLNPYYYQISITYYIDALITHFPNWKDCNIVFFSDELPYCRVHFECLPNAYFTDGLSDIEQIALGSLCDHFIIANSSFGWWQTWLGEKPHSKIVHCGHLHSGKLQEKSEPKDYYPERWTRHQKDDYRLPMKDVVFTIPVHYDHNDRKKNLDLSLCMLQQAFDAEYIIGEQGSDKFEYTKEWATYKKFDLPYFHRTKMLNDMAIMAETDIIANWDCDVFIPPMQVYLTVEAIRNGADMVFPYDGRFARMNRVQWFNKVEKLLDIGVVGGTELKGKNDKPVPVSSVGGAVFFNKDSFIEGGMENENFISFGPEDCERNDRFKTLGFKVERVGGCLYHIDHWVGPNSATTHRHFQHNKAEYEKVHIMTKEQLQAYIDTWPWRHQYTPDYYRRIAEGSIRSAGQVYQALEKIGIKPKSIIDIGCGIGEWKKDGCYTGVDYKIPKKALLIPADHYVECNLEKSFPKLERCDMVVCLEVAEHLEEERAPALIEYLCSLSDKVLFSAAIPYQGGQGHKTERWQSWWEKLFKDNGYGAAEVQPDIRDNEAIELWYKNNLILYVKGGKGQVQDFVHPKYYEQIAGHLKAVA